MAATFTRSAQTDERITTRMDGRQSSRLPSFAPILNEIELAGWSSHRTQLSGNFHDWLPLPGGRIMSAATLSWGEDPADATDAALLAESLRTALRCHAPAAADSGCLLSSVAQSICMGSAGQSQASLAVAIAEPVGGYVSLALAGSCLAVRIRAATTKILSGGAAFGAQTGTAYLDRALELMPRERLVLLASEDESLLKGATRSIPRHFASLQAETHRQMTAREALAHVREACQISSNVDASAWTSLAVIRRR